MGAIEGTSRILSRRCVVKPTDRAREVLATFPRPVGATNAEDDIISAALDFVDVVEAALPHNAAMSPTDKAIRKALYAFLAQLDRATGGADA